MEKNISTCIGEERRGRKETKNSLAQVLENLGYKKWVELGKRLGYHCMAGGLPSYSQPAGMRRRCHGPIHT